MHISVVVWYKIWCYYVFLIQPNVCWIKEFLIGENKTAFKGKCDKLLTESNKLAKVGHFQSVHRVNIPELK